MKNEYEDPYELIRVIKLEKRYRNKNREKIMAVIALGSEKIYEIKRIYNLKAKYRLIVECVEDGKYDIAEINKKRIDNENHPLYRYEDEEDFCLLRLDDRKRNIEGAIIIKCPQVFHLRDCL